jgi:hypothetical protein
MFCGNHPKRMTKPVKRGKHGDGDGDGDRHEYSNGLFDEDLRQET